MICSMRHKKHSHLWDFELKGFFFNYDFFKKYKVSSILKASNAYKTKGIPLITLFQYLFSLIFANRSMYINMLTGKHIEGFAKDTVYRFLNPTSIVEVNKPSDPGTEEPSTTDSGGAPAPTLGEIIVPEDTNEPIKRVYRLYNK